MASRRFAPFSISQIIFIVLGILLLCGASAEGHVASTVCLVGACLVFAAERIIYRLRRIGFLLREANRLAELNSPIRLKEEEEEERPRRMRRRDDEDEDDDHTGGFSLPTGPD